MAITNPSRQTINTTATVSPGATLAQGAKADTALQPIILNTNNPRVDGVLANINDIGYAPDGSRWLKIGAANTAWERIFISTNGEFSANIALANVATDQVPAAGVLGSFRGVPTIGDGATVRGLVLPAGQCKYLTADTATITAVPVDFLTFAVKSGIVYQLRFGGAAQNVKSGGTTLSANLTVYSATAYPMEMSRNTGAFDPGPYEPDTPVYGSGGDRLFNTTELDANMIGTFYDGGSLATPRILFGGEVLIRATADGLISLRCDPYSSPQVVIEQGSYAILTPLAFVA